MLVINGLLKLSEEDIYNEGCLSGTSQLSEVDTSYKHEYCKNLIVNVCESLGFTVDEVKDCVDIAPVEENNRIDIVVMECEDGTRASEQEIEQWKLGKRRLFNCIYTGYVYEQKEFDLTAQKG